MQAADLEEGRARARREWQAMTAYERHRRLVDAYEKRDDTHREPQPAVTDLDVLEASYQFIREQDADAGSDPWVAEMVRVRGSVFLVMNTNCCMDRLARTMPGCTRNSLSLT